MDEREREFLAQTVNEALAIDGGHHKQWYLEQIAKVLELPITVDHEPGIAP